MITDVGGKPLKSLRVTSQTINYFRKHVINKIRNIRSGYMDDRLVHFVLTLPAMWNEQGKQFMKKAAIMVKQADFY